MSTAKGDSVVRERTRLNSLSIKGSTISFHDIEYAVDVRAPGKSCCGGKVKKRILKNIGYVYVTNIATNPNALTVVT